MSLTFNGLDMGLGNLSRLSNAVTRSISAENFTGAKGQAAWRPRARAPMPRARAGAGLEDLALHHICRARATVTLADIAGPGAIQHIWLTVHPDFWRRLVLRIYWDGEATPSVEAPIGDFFCNGWGERCNVTSLPVCRQPGRRLQLLLGDALPQARAHHRREPVAGRGPRLLLPDQLHADRGAGGLGLFPRPVAAQQPAALQAGAHVARRRRRARGTMSAPTWPGASTTTAGGAKARSSSIMDGDADWPTICGTGTEDYFGGAWDFEQPEGRVRRLLHALHWPAAGDQAGRTRTGASSASGCTAGTSWTRSASSRTCA